MADLSSVATSAEMPEVQGLLDFINASPSAFHCVARAAEMLEAAGFTRLSESDEWDVRPGAKHYFTRNQSTLFAFAAGGKYEPAGGVTAVAAHTDSPCLKVKPVSERSAHGCLQVGVECYGGGLWNTWFDRDLSVAGRVIVSVGEGADERFVNRLVRINRPILRIPNLAIHLNRSIYTEGFKPNKETHVLPILATEIKAALVGPAAAAGGDEPKAAGGIARNHHPLLLRVLAEELGVQVGQIQDFELSLYDTQPSQVGGILNEFIFSPRLDNQCMSYCSLRALVESVRDGGLDGETGCRLVALFDNEEIGSQSHRGAFSNMMRETLRRLTGPSYAQAMTRSFLISADMAHAIHPNYASKHEDKHRPTIHGGIVIKHNANQRYATTGFSAFALRRIADRAGLKVQDFVVRNDTSCGSTVGPMLSANCGIRTVDVGIPQWGMHSIRETCGTADIDSSVKLLDIFFREFKALDKSVEEE